MTPAPKIPLRTWAARKWDPPPCRRTLYQWAQNARIVPQPEMIGKTYYVAPDAVYVDKNGNPTT